MSETSEKTLNPEQLALRRQIRADVIIDTLGNTALALGAWGWFGEANNWNHLLREPVVFICLSATGVLNLLYLPKRMKRLKEWQRIKSQ
jgi:hypothetical protein